MAEVIDVLYISYNGIDEPLVHSQVLNYLRCLSQRGYRFTLLTFERPAAATTDSAATRAHLAALGIAWHGVAAHRGWGALSSLRDVLTGMAAARHLLHTQPMHLVHARSFIPALIAWRLARRTGLPFVNDLRGFWVDEKVYRGRLREGGLVYRLAKQLEGRVLRASGAIISLSDRGSRALRDFAIWHGRSLPPMATIPTCVDTDRFVPGVRAPAPQRVFGYVGSLSAEYLPEQIVGYFAKALARFPGSCLQLISRSNAAPILALAAQHGLPPDSIRLVALRPEQVPAEIVRFDVALSFIRPHFSKLASCPTKVGEYLAAGVPVVGNAGIGDMDGLLGDGRVGFLLRDFDAGSIEDSFRHLQSLWDDAGLGMRCRAVALAQFSLREGVDRYDNTYRMLLAQDQRP
ncbi:glycosyltransferase involved in cell wall biosynthesis [Tahibacter aquaticus]|uniref:Glycosyltransferase involved in cell wall biosynthesis n=1 Tax=Tahibacter aquaticus TaxID=520092 RepID=A0A4R6YMG9_9GAMM|nr:glycosyltransferase [Tahibacter aquaticus]TDR38607.1 glycosyltransferase involved in cell wall biosynthesis [Tahibacter aquaticus]